MALATPRPAGVPHSALVPFIDKYREQKFNLLDSKFETNLTVAFAPGTSGSEGIVANIEWASSYIPDPNAPSIPSDNDVVGQWNWLQNPNRWNWQPIPNPTQNTKIEAGTGRNIGGDAEIGTETHPFWNVTPTPSGFSLIDNRTYGFVQPQ